MRTLIFAVLLALLVAPASAQDWGRYDNDRYGYSVGIPPDYLGQGESDNGRGTEGCQKFSRHTKMGERMEYGMLRRLECMIKKASGWADGTEAHNFNRCA